MRRRVHFILSLSAIGVALVAMLWHILATGIVVDAGGLHLTNGQDFLNFWGAPQIAATTTHTLFTGRGYELALHHLYAGEFAQLRWSYPLHSLFFYAPFAALPYLPALALWTACGLALYLAVSWQAWPPRQRGIFCLLLACAPVTLIELITRQNGFFIGAASLLVLLLIERGRPMLAGVLLGCLTIKPQLFLLWPIMLILTRQWRCIGAAIATASLLILASIAVYGIDAWGDYLTFLRDNQWQLLSAEEFNESRKLYHLMMPGLTPALRILHLPDSAVTALQLVVSLGVTGTTIAAFRLPLSFTHRTLILATASLLVSPYNFNYDMTLLSFALLMLWATRPGTLSFYDGAITGIAYLLPLLVYVLNVTDMPLAPIFLLLLLIWSIRDGKNARLAPVRQAPPADQAPAAR